MLSRLFSKLLGRDREASPISDGLVDLLVEMAKFEQPDREAAPKPVVITNGTPSTREALRDFEAAGLARFL